MTSKRIAYDVVFGYGPHAAEHQDEDALMEINTDDYRARVTNRPKNIIIIGPGIKRFGFHPQHARPRRILSQISHESLHPVISKTGGEWASHRLDNYRLFGYAEDITPTGLINAERLEKRMLRLSKRLRR